MTHEIQKPRLALMGEFSAGKSTLANLLLGEAVSPVQVTATQLPPIWYRYGSPEALRVDKSGAVSELDPQDWTGVSPEDTAKIVVSSEIPFLETCDMIDMPGTSDPNMALDAWEAILPEINAVIWCTTANQAWRQSEAALWEQVNDRFLNTSVLLITRMDKLQTERDRKRVATRVKREAGDDFLDVLPISLTQAFEGRGDEDALKASGATDLIERLTGIFSALNPGSKLAEDTVETIAEPDAPQDVHPHYEDRIVPRRFVRDNNPPRRPRPKAEAT